MINKKRNKKISGEPSSKKAYIQESIRPLRHKEILHSGKSEGELPRKRIIGMLNHINFIDGDLYCHVRCANEEEELLLRIKPDPCQGNLIRFKFSEKNVPHSEDLQFLNFVIDDRQSLITFKADIVSREGETLLARIPQKAERFNVRKARRVSSGIIQAEMRGEDWSIEGTLEDFSFSGMRIKLDGSISPSSPFSDQSKSLWVELRSGKDVVFAGKCSVTYYDESDKYVVIVPESFSYPLLPPTKERNLRTKLVPMPKVTFLHPFNGKKIIFDLRELGPTGFSIEESKTDAQLIPGTVIKRIEILFPGEFKLVCSAQIVYSITKNRKKIIHGFSITDVDMPTYCQLFDIVSNAHDPLAKMTSEFDMNELWDFFFKSGFIYPNKYQSLSAYKDEFKKTYQKLYRDCSEIFTSITYQKNGKIYGHNCTIRAYQRAWMIHHLAALPLGKKQVGLELLKQSHFFYDGMYRMPSIGMDYMIIYYRPNNSFPDYFFGGFCRHIKNPKICSMDLFAYFHLPKHLQPNFPSDGWDLSSCSHEDYKQLYKFYEKTSGGLMLEAVGVNQHYLEEPYEKVYERLGLKRKCQTYALKINGHMKAVFFVDEAAMGTNLSDLLNSVKIIVIDQDLPWDILDKAISFVGQRYDADDVTIMIYPYEYVVSHNVKHDKQYYLWITSSKFGNEYVDFIRSQLKFKTYKYLKFIVKRMLR